MAEGSKRRVTIHDLARELNTTPSTISRALQNHPRISREMKKAVFELAEKLNYQPNSIASGLRKGISNTIGVIIPHINRDFFANVIAGIEDVAFENNYKVFICQTHDKAEKEKEYVKTLLGGRVDGVLVSLALESENHEHFKHIQHAGIPLIFFDRVAEDIEASKIMVDDFEGAYKIVSHMIENGYNRIAHFSGNDRINVYRNRKEGYMAALKKHGLSIDSNLIFSHGLKIEDGKRDMAKLWQIKNRPDALFSASDYSALGALLFLKEHGVKVPSEFGIAGFSNETFTSLIDPPMTTVYQHSNEIGHYCANLFFEEVSTTDKPFIPRRTILSPEVLLRKSTAGKEE
jgi:LacI family transcriptional regulator